MRWNYYKYKSTSINIKHMSIRKINTEYKSFNTEQCVLNMYSTLSIFVQYVMLKWSLNPFWKIALFHLYFNIKFRANILQLTSKNKEL